MQRAVVIREMDDVELEQVAGGKGKGGGETEPAQSGGGNDAGRQPAPPLDPAAAAMLPM